MTENLQDAIAELKEAEAVRIVSERLNAGEEPEKMLAEVRDGVQKVVGRYRHGEYGRIDLQMTQLIVERCSEIIASKLGEKPPLLGRILTGTLPSDREEMGRDVTPLVLFGAGFEVIDLGSSVTPQLFIKKAEEVNPDVTAISGLDLDSLQEASQAISGLRQLRRPPKIMIGPLIKCGHLIPIDDDIIRSLGADGGWNDPTESVDTAKELLTVEAEKVVER